MGIPDDYSGEIPLAFIVLNASASKRVEHDFKEVKRIEASIIEAGLF